MGVRACVHTFVKCIRSSENDAASADWEEGLLLLRREKNTMKSAAVSCPESAASHQPA